MALTACWNTLLCIDWKRDISEEEAIIHWYDNVYMPVIHVIRETDILKDFPTKTEGDLYLWVLDHQRYLVDEGKPLQPPGDAARTYLGNECKKTLRVKKKSKTKPRKPEKK